MGRPAGRRDAVRSVFIAIGASALVLAFAGAGLAGPNMPTDQPSATPSGVPTAADPVVWRYGDDTIRWWGHDCESMVVELTMRIQEGEAPDSVVWDSGENCEPIVLDPPTADDGTVTAATTDAATTDATIAAACTTWYNWVHTSHTIQDLPGIDLAWLRTTMKRYWNCNTTYWSEEYGDLFAYDGSGPSWWSHDPPWWAVIKWTCWPLPSSCSQAKAEARAWFHVDFPACSGGHEDIRIDNAVWTQKNTSTIVWQTSKSSTCTGLHSSTGTKQNLSKTDGYGGAQSTTIAVPNVSGT